MFFCEFSMSINKEVEDHAFSGNTVDYIIDSCRSRKYALMKRTFDPFPPPFQMGRSNRWLASEVYAWLARQSSRSAQGEGTLELASTPQPSASVAAAVVPVAGITEMKKLYESGSTLDELCRRFRIGKGRLSASLRAAGTVMRAPGRSRLKTLKGTASERYPWPSVSDRAARANAGGGVA